MAIVRWNPFAEVQDLQRRMNRLFDDSIFRSEKGDEGLMNWTPNVDIFEDDEKIMLSAELPGMDRKDVKIHVENNMLSISGERKLENEEKKDRYTRVERYYGSFQRSFALPNLVNQDKIEAHMEKGVLKVTLPKREESKPKQIEIKVN
jgi:HSP20 family protein